MLTLKGDTIYYDGQAVAWLTIPNGTLRGRVEAAFDDLPSVAPLRDALEAIDQSDNPAKTVHLTADLVKHVEAWLESLKGTTGERLL